MEAYSSLPGYSGEDSESLAITEHRNQKAIEAGRTSPKLLEAAACDRMPEDELAQLHRDTIGALIESTRFPRRRRESLAEAERRTRRGPETLPDGRTEKRLRLAALEAGLKARGNQ